jgi:hypothetical protein
LIKLQYYPRFKMEIIPGMRGMYLIFEIVEGREIEIGNKFQLMGAPHPVRIGGAGRRAGAEMK